MPLSHAIEANAPLDPPPNIFPYDGYMWRWRKEEVIRTNGKFCYICSNGTPRGSSAWKYEFDRTPSTWEFFHPFCVIQLSQQTAEVLRPISPAPPRYETPFDSIARIDSQGDKYWDARELMPLCGYVSDHSFHSAIKKTIHAFVLDGEDPDQYIRNYTDMRIVAGQKAGPRRWDYRLSKEGAYALIQRLDDKKDEVRTAWTYFRRLVLAHEEIQESVPVMGTGVSRAEFEELRAQVQEIPKMVHAVTRALTQEVSTTFEKFRETIRDSGPAQIQGQKGMFSSDYLKSRGRSGSPAEASAFSLKVAEKCKERNVGVPDKIFAPGATRPAYWWPETYWALLDEVFMEKFGE